MKRRLATGNTVAAFQGYPSLPSDDSESEMETEGQANPPTDNVAVMMGQLQQLQTDKAIADIKKKDTSQAFVNTWSETATPNTQDPISLVI